MVVVKVVKSQAGKRKLDKRSMAYGGKGREYREGTEASQEVRAERNARQRDEIGGKIWGPEDMGLAVQHRAQKNVRWSEERSGRNGFA